MRFRDFLEEIYIEDGVSIVKIINSINSYYTIANSNKAEGKFEIYQIDKESVEFAMKNKGYLKVLREKAPPGVWLDFDEFESIIEKRVNLRQLAAKVGIPWKEGNEGPLASWKENSKVKPQQTSVMPQQNSQKKSFLKNLAEKLGFTKKNF